MEHGTHKQRKDAREQRTQERVCGDGAGGVPLEGVDEVVERGLEDGEEAEAHAGEADAGRKPEDVRGRCPAEYEEAGSEEDGAEHHGGEAGFGDGFVVVALELAGVEFVVSG